MSADSANKNTGESTAAELAPPTLNPKQTAFVAEYLIDLNGTQAAIRAGYSPQTAGEIASEYLAKPAIAAAVERGKAQRLSRVGMTADSVLHEMSLLSHSRIDHYYVDDEGQVKLAEGAPDGAMGAIQSINRKTKVVTDKDGNVTRTYDVTIKLWDKPQPLKLMGKHANVAACFDRVELSGPNGGPIPVTEIRSIIVDPKETNNAGS